MGMEVCRNLGRYDKRFWTGRKTKNFPASETLILFKPYEKPLEIIQENLRLRNQYNQLKSGDKKDNIKVMEDDIQKQIESLPFSPELYIYNSKSDNCLKI